MAAVKRPNWLRWSRTINQQGFTLIELVIVIVIIGVLSVLIAVPLMEGTRGWVDVSTRKDLAQQGRLAMDRMIREIRNTARKADDTPCISAATTTAYTFSDVSGDLVNCNSTSFTVSGSQLLRGSNVLADHVSSFQWTYLNNSNNSTATLSAIRRVSIAVTFSNGTESLSLNGEVYLRNMKGY
jgi:prepilin-type N-terminal cleavage/methylation domain-containing protein